jgi:uncharacterized membrane protein YgaE (UPF0421/DUF939 family)
MTVLLARPVSAVRTAAWNHPHAITAVKSALAASLAWLAVQPWGGVAASYPYYAPLGATVAMSTTIVNSIRNSLQAVYAILLGAAIALTVDAAHVPQVLAIAVVIGVGTGLSTWRRLGSMGSWVPFTALFVLIVGGADPWRYVFAYGALTALGTVVGIAVNWLLPQVPLSPADRALARLREQIADQFDALSEGLRAPGPLSPLQWQEICVSLQPQARQAKALISKVLESERGNWRAKRWWDLARQRYSQIERLEGLTSRIDILIDLISDPHASLHDADDDGELLRLATAEALSSVAAMLRVPDPDGDEHRQGGARDEARRQAVEAVANLKSVLVRVGLGPDGQNTTAAAVVTSIERSVGGWR